MKQRKHFLSIVIVFAYIFILIVSSINIVYAAPDDITETVISRDAFDNLGFVPLDTAIDPDRNVAYATETDGNDLYRIDLTTGDITTLNFINKPEKLAVKNGKIYLSVTNSINTCEITVIDTAAFTIDNTFSIPILVYDIEADNQGNIYINSDSTGYPDFSCYEPSTGSLISMVGEADEMCLLDYNDQYDKLYFLPQNISPEYLTAFEIDDGEFTTQTPWSYNGDYDLASYIKISPDGQFIFSGSGNIFKSSQVASEDMIYNNNIDEFSSICFDMKNNVFYTVNGNTLSAYNYYTGEKADETISTDEYIEIFYSNNSLISLKKNASDEYYFDFETETEIGSQKIALLFGMADYTGTENDLDGPVNDMIGNKAVLEECGYTVYKYMDYTSQQVLTLVQAVASNMSPDNTLMFVYSGHGSDGGYLIGSDLTGISINNLESCLSQHTGVKEVIIDACYSGDFIGRNIQEDSVDMIQSQKEFNDYIISAFKNSDTVMNSRNLAQNGYYVITASTGEQYSYEKRFYLPDSPFAANNLVPIVINYQTFYQLGCFTQAFQDGFGLYESVPFSDMWADDNSDGYITWNEIYQHAADETDELQQAQVYPENSDHILHSPPPILVTGVTIDDVEVEIGTPFQLNPIISPADATNKTVTYTSSNEAAATVNSSGIVTGISPGTTIIEVETDDGGYTDTCTATIIQPVTSVELTGNSNSILVGNTTQLTATVYPANAANKNVSFSSSNQSIASVNASGLVTGIAPGTAVITVTTEDKGLTDNYSITVIQPVTSVELDYESKILPIDKTLQLTATVLPTNASNKSVVYTSSNNNIATVSSTGLVSGVSVGTATITVETVDGEFTDTCEIEVVDSSIESDTYTVNKAKEYLEDIAIGATAQDIINSINDTTGQLRILDTEMQVVAGNANVSTGYYIQLIIDGEVVDQLRILIKGDLKPDGILDVVDYTLIRLHILGISTLSDISLDAADVNEDGVIDVVDYTMVRLHILGISPLY